MSLGRRTMRDAWALGVALALVLAGPALRAAAHTETDVVAAPAGSEVTVHLTVTHGCDTSPTVMLFTRMPVADAVAEPLAGWKVESAPDEAGRPIISWRGGSLPADQEGEFPVTFTVPDTPGELVVMPFIQGCENGEELEWIDGDPASEYPAPRLLVLPAGSEPAATIDEVPPDAPGRDKLTAEVDVVDPETGSAPTTAGATTTTESTGTTAGSSSSTTAPATDSDTGSDPAEDEDDSSGPSPAVWWAIGIGAVSTGLFKAWRWSRGSP